jgi:hypothetical protein
MGPIFTAAMVPEMRAAIKVWEHWLGRSTRRVKCSAPPMPLLRRAAWEAVVLPLTRFCLRQAGPSVKQVGTREFGAIPR